MTRKLTSTVAAIALLAATSAFAQDDSGGATSGGVTSGGAASSTAPVAPNAPLQATDQGPLPAGAEAGTAVAPVWYADPLTLGIGAAVIGAAICIAVCGSNSTSSTTTTAHK